MRTIKFRAKIKAESFELKLAMLDKPKSEEEWVCGDLHICDTKIPHIHCVMNKYPIDVSTIGQFINLRDKHMKEMFEGDIVQDENGAIGYIGYLQEEMGFCIIWSHSYSRLGIRTRGGGYEVDPSLEIIGNVHDNPELLTNKEQI